MSSFIYQILHPWHWITYGQNASAVGLIVLVLYTIYTRKMMLEAELTRRGSLTPRLVLLGGTNASISFENEIANVGGPAINFALYRLKGPDSLRMARYGLKIPKDEPEFLQGVLLKENAPIKFTARPPAISDPSVYIAVCNDVFGEVYQLQVFVVHGSGPLAQVSSTWVTPRYIGNTWIQRFTKKAAMPIVRAWARRKWMPRPDDTQS